MLALSGWAWGQSALRQWEQDRGAAEPQVCSEDGTPAGPSPSTRCVENGLREEATAQRGPAVPRPLPGHVAGRAGAGGPGSPAAQSQPLVPLSLAGPRGHWRLCQKWDRRVGGVMVAVTVGGLRDRWPGVEGWDTGRGVCLWVTSWRPCRPSPAAGLVCPLWGARETTATGDSDSWAGGGGPVPKGMGDSSAGRSTGPFFLATWDPLGGESSEGPVEGGPGPPPQCSRAFWAHQTPLGSPAPRSWAANLLGHS